MDLLKKLNVKDQKTALIINLPEDMKAMIDSWREVLDVEFEPNGGIYPFVLLFAKDRDSLVKGKDILKRVMDPKELIWVAYPKKSSRNYKSDLSRDDFWEALKDLGLEPVRQVALSDDWSALRFKKGEDIKRKGD